MDTAPTARITALHQTLSASATPKTLDELVSAMDGEADLLEALAQGTPGARAVSEARAKYADIIGDTHLRNRAMQATDAAIDSLAAGESLASVLATMATTPDVGPLLAATVHTADDIKALHVGAFASVLEFIRDVDLSSPEPNKPSEPDVVEPRPEPTEPKLPSGIIPTTLKGLVAYAESNPDPAEVPAMIAFLQQTPLADSLLEASIAIHALMPENPTLEDQVAFGRRAEELVGLARKDLGKHSPAAAVTALGQRSSQGSGLARAIIGERNIFKDADEVADRIQLFWAVLRLGNIGISEVTKSDA